MARTGAFLAGIGSAAVGYYFMRESLWARADGAAFAGHEIQSKVPGMNRRVEVRHHGAVPGKSSAPHNHSSAYIFPKIARIAEQVSRADSPADRVGHVLGGDALKQAGDAVKHQWNRAVFKSRDFVAKNMFEDEQRR